MGELSIPCEFWDDDKQECRVTALFNSEAGETLWPGASCRSEVDRDQTRHRVTGCRLRGLALGAELYPDPKWSEPYSVWDERTRYLMGRYAKTLETQRKLLDKS